MSIDEVYKKLRKQPVELDEVQKRRVLWNVLSRGPWPRKSRAPLVVAVAAVAVAAAAVALALVIDTSVVDDTGGEPPATGDHDELPTLALAGLGRAILQPGADVSIESKTDDLLEVVQTGGVVRYEIDRPRGHEVVVRAGGYEIKVVGTVFEIAVDESDLSVRVEEGVVQIEDDRRIVTLVAGDEITTAVHDEDQRRAEIAAAEPVPAPEAAEQADADSQGEARPTAPPSTDAPDEPLQSEPTDARAVPAPGELDAPDSPENVESQPAITPRRTIEEMLSSVDEARRNGALAEASRLLDQIVTRFPYDRRSINALFTMGNVERQLGNHAKAARAYDRCWQLKPAGLLAEDARAEAAVSWARAGRKDLARKGATDYLELYPQGNHAARMKKLIE